MQHKNRPLRRCSPSLHPKKRILILCEGRETEPTYFDGLRLQEQARTVEIKIDNRGGVPKTLVERAVAELKASRRAARGAGDQNLSYDEVWCVFDVDEHPNLPDAQQQAHAHGIKLAVSNPCFELWLLLHFREQTASIERHALQTECRKCMPKFNKSVSFEEVKYGVDDAVQRAIKLEKWQAERYSSGENPSTDVHKLVLVIKDSGKGFHQSETDTATP